MGQITSSCKPNKTGKLKPKEEEETAVIEVAEKAGAAAQTQQQQQEPKKMSNHLGAPKAFPTRQRRPSIASAPTDPNAVMKTYPKSDEEREYLMTKVRDSKHFLLKDLTEPQVVMFVGALEKKPVTAGQIICTQGETGGEHFYLLGAGGGCEVFVKRPENPGDKVVGIGDNGDYGANVLTIGEGGSFGELALMYMCERQATVKSTIDCDLWQIEQTQFRTMLANLQQTEKTAVKDLLKTNPLFQTLNQFELTTLVDAMHESPLTYSDGATVIRQGEDVTGTDEEGAEGQKKGCFIVATGTCEAMLKEGEEERVVKRYTCGEHFGELALITDEPTRRATVKCTSDCEFYYISKEKFESLVGPVKEILGRDKDKYKTFEEGEATCTNGS